MEFKLTQTAVHVQTTQASTHSVKINNLAGRVKSDFHGHNRRTVDKVQEELVHGGSALGTANLESHDLST